MRFVDYVKGERLAFLSDLPPGDVARRLEAVLPPLWARFPTGVVGWVAFGHFSLRCHRNLWLRRGYLPILTGHIRPHEGGSRISLHYRAPRRLLVILGLWAGLMLGVLLKGSGPVPDLIQVLLLMGSAFALTAVISIATLGNEAADDLVTMLAVVEAAADRNG